MFFIFISFNCMLNYFGVDSLNLFITLRKYVMKLFEKRSIGFNFFCTIFHSNHSVVYNVGNLGDIDIEWLILFPSMYTSLDGRKYWYQSKYPNMFKLFCLASNLFNSRRKYDWWRISSLDLSKLVCADKRCIYFLMPIPNE